MEFKNRKKEAKEIKEVLDSKKFELLILYGRRRVGKTELGLHATKNRKRIYYLATEEKNLDRFYDVCAEYDKNILDLKKDFEVLFNYLKDKVEVVIIDEFQNMIKEDKNIISLFQSIVDTKLKDSNVKLILLGSSISIIASKVLSYKSPLYGRRTGSIKLKPISFFDVHEFFPESAMDELVEIYGFADGIPYYLIKIDKPFWEWLSRELKQERSFLKDEVSFLMKYEFENPSTYKLILEAIANGKTKLSEIKDFVKLERTDLSPYLKNLMEVNLIKREVSVVENIKSRKGRYYLNDNFLRFWFRFIYPHLSSIESGIFDTSIIKRAYPEYLGFIFEEIARQYILRENIFKCNKIGRWWYKDNEIDIVALNDEKREILLGECKWKENVNPEEIALKLYEKSEYVEWHNKDRKESYAVFAKSFKRKISEFKGRKVYCFDLGDLSKK